MSHLISKSLQSGDIVILAFVVAFECHLDILPSTELPLTSLDIFYLSDNYRTIHPYELDT